MNDQDRAQWVDNDEGLYCWWQRERQGKATFIRAHRAEIDAMIQQVQTGAQPAHSLRYGPARRGHNTPTRPTY